MSNLHCGDGDVLLCGDVARGHLEELVDVVDEGEDDEDGHVDPALALHFKIQLAWNFQDARAQNFRTQLPGNESCELPIMIILRWYDVLQGGPTWFYTWYWSDQYSVWQMPY